MAEATVANGHLRKEATAPKPSETEFNGTPLEPHQPTQKKPPRKKGRYYAQIHSKPLPLDVHPLPAFHPSNPISLLRLCYVYLSQLLAAPSSHHSHPYIGHFNPDTRSIHVTDPTHIRALWEMGFFGKASLSRSEPTWLEREKARLRAERDGKGEKGEKGVRAAEEVTSARREERRLFKLERARAEREKIERQRAVERGVVKVDVVSELSADATQISAGVDVAEDEDESQTVGGVPSEVDGVEQTNSEVAEGLPKVTTVGTVHNEPEKPLLPKGGEATQITTPPVAIEPADADEPDFDFQNQEHLQLTLEDAFFLSFGLGVLTINLPQTHQPSRPPPELLTLFATHSTFPTDQPRSRSRVPVPSLAVNNQPLHARAVSHAIASAPLVKGPTESSLRVPLIAAPLIPQPPSHFPAPDNQFLLNYVVYHHFRSLGWVVRPGLKFGVDYVLYNRGPVFSHAEFAVMILPAYTAEYWATSAGKAERRVKAEKDWWWLHCVNRVQGQVKKTLVLCYVEVPAPVSDEDVRGARGCVDVARLLRRYKVRELVVRRWAVNRSRD